jgi:hypothetical protein
LKAFGQQHKKENGERFEQSKAKKHPILTKKYGFKVKSDFSDCFLAPGLAALHGERGAAPSAVR